MTQFFIHNKGLFKADEIEKYNRWLTKNNKPNIFPVFFEAPDDADISDFVEEVFSEEKYLARIQKEKEVKYRALVHHLIRQRYDEDEEFSMLRQRDDKPEEFAEYNAYVEECKVQAKKSIGL